MMETKNNALESAMARGMLRFIEGSLAARQMMDAITPAVADALGETLDKVRGVEARKALDQYAAARGADANDLLLEWGANSQEEFQLLSEQVSTARRKALGI